MKKETKDFISVYSDVYEDGFCEHIISEFERLSLSGATRDRIQSEGASRHIKDDTHLFLNFKNHPMEGFNDRAVTDIFFEGLQKCFEDYTNDYALLKNICLRATHVKIQRTDPGQGYHVWHAEQENEDSAARILVYSLYLNTLALEEAGETEYLYQQRRVNPVENTLIIWPAGFTHAHRGNTVFGNRSKYIVTGWFYLD